MQAPGKVPKAPSISKKGNWEKAVVCGNQENTEVVGSPLLVMLAERDRQGSCEGVTEAKKGCVV